MRDNQFPEDKDKYGFTIILTGTPAVQFPEGFEWLDARDDRCEKWLEWKEENCECGISEITGKWSEELAERVGCICEELNFDLYLELVGDAAFPKKLEGVSDD